MVDIHKVYTQNYRGKKIVIQIAVEQESLVQMACRYFCLFLFLVTCLKGIALTWYFKNPITCTGSVIISDLMLPRDSRVLAHQLKKAAVCNMGSSILSVFSTSNIL